MRPAAGGYDGRMRDYQTEGKPVDLGDVADQEQLSTADAADRLDDDPAEAENRSEVPDDPISLADRTVPEDR
jgi:hypothetical protein